MLCISILGQQQLSEPCFLPPLFRHYCVKSLAYTPVYAAFLPCTDKKIVCKKFFELETDKILCSF